MAPLGPPPPEPPYFKPGEWELLPDEEKLGTLIEFLSRVTQQAAQITRLLGLPVEFIGVAALQDGRGLFMGTCDRAEAHRALASLFQHLEQGNHSQGMAELGAEGLINLRKVD